MKHNGLTKKEKVKSETVATALFGKNAHAVSCQGFRFNWIITDPKTAQGCQVMFLGPRKKLPHATQRNRRKRLLRELYRLNKHALLNFLAETNLSLALSIHYTAAAELSFHLHEPQFKKALQQLILEIKRYHTSTLPAAH